LSKDRENVKKHYTGSNLSIINKYIIRLRKEAFTKWIEFLKVAIPIGSILTLEWLCYEMYTIQAAHLDEVVKNNIFKFLNFSNLPLM